MNKIFPILILVIAIILPAVNAQLPDFYIDSGHLVNNISCGNLIILEFTIHTIGNVDPNIDTRVYKDNILLNIPKLNFPASGARTGTLVFQRLNPGIHNITIYIDTTKSYDESNENNNIFQFLFNSTAACEHNNQTNQTNQTQNLVDLFIDNGYLSNNICENQSAIISFNTNTIGSNISEVKIKAFRDNMLINWLSSLPFPQSTGFIDNKLNLGLLNPGTHNLTIYTDSDNKYNETNENNNIFQFLFDVKNCKNQTQETENKTCDNKNKIQFPQINDTEQVPGRINLSYYPINQTSNNIEAEFFNSGFFYIIIIMLIILIIILIILILKYR